MAIGVVPLAAFYLTVVMLYNAQYLSSREEILARMAEGVATEIARNDYLEASSALQAIVENRGLEGDFRVLVVGEEGDVLADSWLEFGNIPEAYHPTAGQTISGRSRLNMYAAAVVPSASYSVLFISPLESAVTNEMNRQAILFATSVAIIITGLSFLVSSLMLRRLNRFMHVVVSAAEGNFGETVDIQGNDEFSLLGEAFNNMTNRLAESESSREEFVANVSHELKTPLSSIKVLTESILLADNTSRQVYDEFLRDINSEIDRMTNIVSDLLELVKLDRSEAALNLGPTNIGRLVKDVLRRLYPLAHRKNIILMYENIRNVTTMADEMKLGLAVSNVVENAIKYTNPYGTVTVTIDCDHQYVFISVSDTGIGIAEEDQLKIFTRFYRADKTRNRETGGTGLGLSITHATILMHEGNIRLSSKESEGSTFFIRLPIRRR